jgi:hypothetical protein
VRHRRHLCEQLRLDVVARAQNLDRLDAGIVRRLDEILALDDEQPLPLALPSRVEQAGGSAAASGCAPT